MKSDWVRESKKETENYLLAQRIIYLHILSVTTKPVHNKKIEWKKLRLLLVIMQGNINLLYMYIKISYVHFTINFDNIMNFLQKFYFINI